MLRCWAALTCIVLVLLLSAIEATHAHSDVSSVRSSPCAICLSVHGNAPAITYHPLPTLSALETLALPAVAESHGILQELSLFIRPPPVA
jgi:hypothetical protein